MRNAMGDIRFLEAYDRLRKAKDRSAALRALSDDDVIQALAAASLEVKDPYLANVVASEALNRLRRAATMREHVAEAILQVDPEGICLDANPAALRLLGRPKRGLVGASLADTLELRSADGESFDPFRKEAFASGVTSGKARVRRRNGQMMDVAYRNAPVLVDDELVGAIVALHDVSDETRTQRALGLSDARHRVLLDSVPDQALVLLDANGIIECWNEGAQRLHARPAEEVVGRHFRSLFTREDQDREVPEHELALAARHGRYHTRQDRVRGDETTFRAEVDIAAIRDPSGIRGFALVERQLGGE